MTDKQSGELLPAELIKCVISALRGASFVSSAYDRHMCFVGVVQAM